MKIDRFSQTVLSLAITASAATTAEIGYEGWASGMVYVPSGSSLTSLTWYVAPVSGGTYVAAQDGAGNAKTSTVSAGKAVPIPADLLGAGALKAVGNTTGTIDVSLKG